MDLHNRVQSAVPLNAANLPAFSADVRPPGYERRSQPLGIVHIGVGGFHRAHQAVYLDDLMHRPSFEGWSLCGVGLLPRDRAIAEAMRKQDCLYTVMERGASGDNLRIVGSITEFLFAPDDPETVIEKMASTQCRIVSLTITEGGYYVNQGTGVFDAGHPDILHDLAHPGEPTCVYGYLAEALDRRRRRSLLPFTLMSCDNLQNNGDVLRRMFLSFARLRDPDLADWLSTFGAFPNSMVDRITPAASQEHAELVRERFGIADACPVVTEPFRQWVIEDRFCDGRPPWEKVGALLTEDVLPYEKMKIRLLNGSHQALCYIGMLLGYEFVHQALGDARIRKLLRTLMDEEVSPLIPTVPGIDLEEYKTTLIERFSNPTIGDRLARIGTEGSARIPKFVLPSILEQLERGGRIRLLSFTVAAWFRYLTGRGDAGESLPFQDPLEKVLREKALRGGSDPRELLAIRELFGDVLPERPAFVEEVERALECFYTRGADAALAEYTTGG